MTSINLNAKCNQNCIFCQRNRFVPKDEPSNEEIQKIILDAANIDPERQRSIFFMGGGEPTMRENLVELIAFARKLGFSQIGIETNAVKLADETYAKGLIDAGLSFAHVSIHSWREDISDYVSGAKGTFQKTVAGMHNLEKNGVRIENILHTITEASYRELKEMIDFLADNFSIRKISYGFIRPIPKDEKNKKLTPKLSDAELFIHEAFAHSKKRGISFSLSNGGSIPLCYAPENEQHSCEAFVYISNGKQVFEEEVHIHEKVKGDACKACFISELCSGITKQYSELYGTSELYPVFLNKQNLIRQVKAINGFKTNVAVVKCADYSSDNVKMAVRHSIELLGGLNRFIKPGSKVLIKPNLLIPANPDSAATTHPEIVRAVVELVSEITKNIYVGDSSMAGQTNEAFDKCGIAKTLKDTAAKPCNFDETGYVARDIAHFSILNRTDFAKAALDADVIINLPKLKTHGITFFTGAIKNMFGCIHQNERAYLHRIEDRNRFSEGLVDIFSFFKEKITLNIMDAVVGMEGDEGPSYGHPRQVKLIIASSDAVALDAIASEIIGYQAMAIPTTKNASERGFGEGDIRNITILGETLQDIGVPDFAKNSLFDFINKYKKKGCFDINNVRETCTKCGICRQICPVGAIALVPFPEIDRKKCIHCYCCHEACPNGAISLIKISE